MGNIDPVIATVARRVGSAARRVLMSIATTIREALRPAPIATGFLRDLLRTREELVTENAALRQQLIVASRKVKRPVLHSWERGLLVVLASRLKNLRNTILLVKPETILRWASRKLSALLEAHVEGRQIARSTHRARDHRPHSSHGPR